MDVVTGRRRHEPQDRRTDPGDQLTGYDFLFTAQARRPPQHAHQPYSGHPSRQSMEIYSCQLAFYVTVTRSLMPDWNWPGMWQAIVTIPGTPK